MHPIIGLPFEMRGFDKLNLTNVAKAGDRATHPNTSQPAATHFEILGLLLCLTVQTLFPVSLSALVWPNYLKCCNKTTLFKCMTYIIASDI